jgi:hypothetical protein
MSDADRSENPATKRKPPLVYRFLGFLGFSDPARNGDKVVPSTSDAATMPTPPPAVAVPSNGIHETLSELAGLVEGAPVPAQRSNLEDTRIINLQRQSEELSLALIKKGDTCKRRLTGIRERIEQKIKEAEAMGSESD